MIYPMNIIINIDKKYLEEKLAYLVNRKPCQKREQDEPANTAKKRKIHCEHYTGKQRRGKKGLFYVVYKTTNVITGEYYIGKHVTRDLSDGYLGSGTIFKRAVEFWRKK